MWWIKWYWDRFLSQYCHYPISVSFPQCSILIIIWIQLKRGQVFEVSSLQTKWYTLGYFRTSFFVCLKEWNCLIVVRVECIWILWQRIQSVFYDKFYIYRSPWDTCTDRKTLQYWEVWCIILWCSQQTGTKHGPTMPHAAGEDIWSYCGCRLAVLNFVLLVICGIQTVENYMNYCFTICTVHLVLSGWRK